MLFFYSSKQPHVRLDGLVTYLQVRTQLLEEPQPCLSNSLFTLLLQFAVCWLWPSHPKGFPAAVAAAGNQSTGLFFQGIQRSQLQGSGSASKHGLDQGSLCAAGDKDATNKAIPSARWCHAEMALLATVIKRSFGWGCREATVNSSDTWSGDFPLFLSLPSSCRRGGDNEGHSLLH